MLSRYLLLELELTELQYNFTVDLYFVFSVDLRPEIRP